MITREGFMIGFACYMLVVSALCFYGVWLLR